MTKMSFGQAYEVADATYSSWPIRSHELRHARSARRQGSAVNNTTTMRGAIARLKNAEVTGYQTYDEMPRLLESGQIDAFALSRDQLNAMAKKIPGTRVLDETFKKDHHRGAVPLNHRSRWRLSPNS